MERKDKIEIKVELDENMLKIVSIINRRIQSGQYNLPSFSSFVEIAINVFDTILSNEITPEQFDFFIQSHQKNKKDNLA